MEEIQRISLLGRGGIAEVWQADWQGRRVALKVLLRPDSQSLKTRFLREGRLLMRLSHTRLVRCLEVVEEPPMLVLELLAGATLHAHLRHPLNDEAGLKLATALLEVLQYLHDHGIIHRDLKPANIFIGEAGEIVLMDLGMATDPSDPAVTTLGDVFGTQAYMAPEQLAGVPCSARADLYSLGVTLYEALSGHRPYEADSLSGWLAAHRSGEHPSLETRVPGISPPLARLVERLLARDPWARPPSAAAALALLGRPNVQGRLMPPAPMGCGALIGAAWAVMDGGGDLCVIAEPGAGLSLAARLILNMIVETHSEYLRIRVRPRAPDSEIYQVFARELSAIIGEVPPHPQEIAHQIAALHRENGRLILVVEHTEFLSTACLAFIRSLTAEKFLLGTLSLPDCPQLQLRPLNEQEVTQLAQSMVGSNVPGLGAALYRWTGGLAGLVVEGIRDLQRRGGLSWTVEGWHWDPMLRPIMDPREAARSMMSRLGDETAVLLVELVVVASEPVPLSLIERLLNAPMEAAVWASGILEVDDLGRVQLRRPALEPLLLSGISAAQRVKLHHRLAAACADDPQLERFALVQAALAGEGAIHTLIEEGQLLLEEGQEERVLALLERVPVRQDLPPDLLVALWSLRADALRQVGSLLEAKELMNHASKLSSEMSSPNLWRTMVLSEAELALDMGSQPSKDVLVLLQSLLSEEARGHLIHARLLARQGDRLGAWEHLKRGPEQGSMWVERCLLETRLYMDAGQMWEAQAHVEALQIYKKVSWLSAELFMRRADFHHFHQVLRDLEQAPYRWGSLQQTLLMATVALSEGHLEQASDLLQPAKPPAYGTPWRLRLRHAGLVAWLGRLVGDLPLAVEGHLRARTLAEHAGDGVYAAYHTGMLGICSGDGETIGKAAQQLVEMDVPHLLAELYLAGAEVGRDPALLPAAWEAAQRSGEELLCRRVQGAVVGDTPLPALDALPEGLRYFLSRP